MVRYFNNLSTTPKGKTPPVSRWEISCDIAPSEEEESEVVFYRWEIEDF
jgi:hypothetical protein